MSSVQIQGNAAGAGVFTIASPNSASSYTATLPAATTTLVGTDATQTLTNKTLGSGLVAGASLITSGTAVATTSGTAIDFTSIPSWVKRITVMFNNVSGSGTSAQVVQIGSGSIQTTGYGSGSEQGNTGVAPRVSTTYFYATGTSNAGGQSTGHVVLTNVSGNIWVQSGLIIDSVNGSSSANLSYTISSGVVTLSGVLDRIRITTANGTDTFDGGSINILYE
jgi:hypothetical protein